MKNVLDVEVSCFQNCFTPGNPKSVNLLSWLKSKKYAHIVDSIRAIDNKEQRDEEKRQLPAITPSGKFHYKANDQLIRHSGLLQFDLDRQDNQHLENFSDLMEYVKNISNVAYCGLSVSGKGFWGLVPIAYPEKHNAHFDALVNDFRRFGLNCDTKVRPVSSLRVYSCDDKSYFNPYAKVYEKTSIENTDLITIKRKIMTSEAGGNEKEATVKRIVNDLTTSKSDITTSYQAWFQIGCALANEFGEQGRDYYHLISQYHPKYTFNSCNRQYDHCLKRNYGYRLGTVVYYWKLIKND